jgi:protein TonB
MRWSMLPVSICVHVALGILALIVPLGADEWPVPPPLHSPYVAIKTIPVAPAVVPPSPSRRTRAVSVIAPSTIERERELPPEPAGAVGPAGPGGIPLSEINLSNGLGTEAKVTPPSPPPPVPIPRPTLVRAGQGVREPKKIVDVRPVYPAIAQSVKVQGSVILEAVINERGSVERIKILRSVPLLDAAAIAAVQAWRYTPTTLNGVPVSVLMTITINFTLND